MRRSMDKSPVPITLDEALEYNPVGFFQYRLLLLCGFMFMADSLEVNLLVYVSTCASIEWDLSYSQQASITGVVFVGIVLGSLFWGIIADRYGRKATFLIAASLISGGGFLSGIAPSYEWLLFFRTICGFGIGGANIPIDLLAEFLPSTHRGNFIVCIEYFWTFGSLLVTSIAWLSLSTHGWRTLAYITAVPVTLTCIFSIWYLPESPRWLLMKGRNAEAEKIVRDAALVNNITMAPFTLIGDEKVHEHDKDAKYRDLLLIPDLRRITLPLWIVWASFGFTYYGLILFVGRLYEIKGNSHDGSHLSHVCSFDYAAVFVNASAEIVGVIVAAYAVDKYGRIYTQKVFYLLAALTAIFMGINLPLGVLLTVSLLGRMSVFAASNATWVSTPELYTTETRTVGHASSLAWSKMGAFVSPYVVVSSLSPFALGVILGVMNVFAAVAAHMLPETGGRFLENYDREVPSTSSSSSSNKNVAMIAFNNKYNLMALDDELTVHQGGSFNALHAGGTNSSVIVDESP